MADTADWRGDLGATWARNSDIMDLKLNVFGEAAAAALGPVEGKRVLDLGCGGGATTRALAEAVGADGAAIGLDVSPDLVALAEARSKASGSAARFICADASTIRFETPFDAVYSRFGAMFFADPPAAWANLRAAAQPGAPLAIACWRAPSANEWAMLPLNAVKPFLDPVPPQPHDAPGPFAWAIPEETFAPILSKAGWKNVAWRAVDAQLALGQGYDDPDPVARAMGFAAEIGPLSRRLAELEGERREQALAALRSALEARLVGDAVLVAGAVWIVTATA